jgi:predicted RND superfamily exporter protein
MGNEVARSSIKSAITSLLLIFLFMTVIFRSLRYGLASLVPNVMPMGIGYGIWALYHGELDMNQLSVFCITLGIVVDDTIHFLSKYLRARRSLGMDSENSVHYAFEHVGQPLWITTAVLVTGFGLLMFSGFAPNFNLGFLASVILLSGLALDYLFLPALLLLLDRSKPSSQAFSG